MTRDELYQTRSLSQIIEILPIKNIDLDPPHSGDHVLVMSGFCLGIVRTDGPVEPIDIQTPFKDFAVLMVDKEGS